MFLPDRFIKGTCPRCGTPDQYGDACENCGATYSPADLKNPVSVISGTRPVEKESEHYFFKLGDFSEVLKHWMAESKLHPAVRAKLDEWFQAGLQDWDISRDAPYFGFEIPDAPGKYFYVWLDAPIGYFASFKNLAAKKGDIDVAVYTEAAPAASAGTELVHFIGKDILYFHALFWPAMLQFAGYRTPTHLACNDFLTVDGAKMSKSRGTFITARSYIEQKLNPEWLRYYFASKSNGSMEDVDLNLDDMIAKVNSDLVGKFVNIASRCAGFITKKFGGRLSPNVLGADLLERLTDDAQVSIEQLRASPDQLEAMVLMPYVDFSREVSEFYESRDLAAAIREIMHMADGINFYVAQVKPWELAKDTSQDQRLHETSSFILNLFRLLAIYLKPILPTTAERIEQFLNIAPLTWDDRLELLPGGHKINTYEHLMTRAERKQIDALLEANKESLAPVSSPLPPGEGSGVREGGSRKVPLPADLLGKARNLRENQTDAEALMWHLLRDRQIGGAKFRRQHPLEMSNGKRYVLDFYCHEQKLAVELDGGQHSEQAAYDAARSEALEAMSIRVLRFWNNQVLGETEALKI